MWACFKMRFIALKKKKSDELKACTSHDSVILQMFKLTCGSPWLESLRGVRVTLFSWFPLFWIFLGQNFSFFFYFQPIFDILPWFHAVFPHFLPVASYTSDPCSTPVSSFLLFVHLSIRPSVHPSVRPPVHPLFLLFNPIHSIKVLWVRDNNQDQSVNKFLSYSSKIYLFIYAY